MTQNRYLLSVWYMFWAVFVNACNVWLIRPLALDYALLGIVAVFAVAIIWMSSIPKSARRRWLGFTVFSLLLGRGLDQLTTRSLLSHILLGLVMVIGLVLIVSLFAKVRLVYALSSAILLVAVNAILPMAEWPFLTHFTVAFNKRLPFQPGDIPALPLQVIHSGNKTTVMTVDNLQEPEIQLEKAAEKATSTPQSLGDVLRNYKHRYTFVALTQKNGHFVLQTPTPQDLSQVSPIKFVSTFFPLIRAYWAVEGKRVVQYMVPAHTPNVLSQVAVNAALFPENFATIADTTQSQERQAWTSTLAQLGVSAPTDQLRVENGFLVGSYQGQSMHAAVQAQYVVGAGSFTAAHVPQILVEGPNLLQVVSVRDDRVISTYHGEVKNPLSNDMVIGPLSNNGRDVVFVNGSPAQILSVAGGHWRTLYTAPNESLRFEASVKFKGDSEPEIITDDPSYMRNSPIRYFTSYTYRNGQLVRNWRVYRTNVVNVRQAAFGGQQYLITAIYGSGDLLVLRRHHVPVVPMTSLGLGIIVVLGWWMRWKEKRGALNA